MKNLNLSSVGATLAVALHPHAVALHPNAIGKAFTAIGGPLT